MAVTVPFQRENNT